MSIYDLKYSPNEHHPYRENVDDLERLRMITLSNVLSSEDTARMSFLLRDARYSVKKDDALEDKIVDLKNKFKNFIENEEKKYDKVIDGHVLNKEELYDTPIGIELPISAEIVSIKGFRENDIILFVSHDLGEEETRKRTFLLVPMGEAYKSKEMVFIDTVIFGGGEKLTQVFEIIKPILK